jgi:hypothetical protein
MGYWKRLIPEGAFFGGEGVGYMGVRTGDIADILNRDRPDRLGRRAGCGLIFMGACFVVPLCAGGSIFCANPCGEADAARRRKVIQGVLWATQDHAEADRRTLADL